MTFIFIQRPVGIHGRRVDNSASIAYLGIANKNNFFGQYWGLGIIQQKNTL